MISSRMLRFAGATVGPQFRSFYVSSIPRESPISFQKCGRSRLFTTNPKPPETPLKEASEKITSTSSTTSNSGSQSSSISQLWARFIGPKEMPPRGTFAWYREMVLVCTVFAITGSSTMILVRPAVGKGLGLEGSLKDGPWSYRICSLVIMTPIYATLLVVVGTVFGRHHYFRHFSVKMWSRFGIPPEMIDPTYHQTKKHFRKW